MLTFNKEHVAGGKELTKFTQQPSGDRILTTDLKKSRVRFISRCGSVAIIIMYRSMIIEFDAGYAAAGLACRLAAPDLVLQQIIQFRNSALQRPLYI